MNSNSKTVTALIAGLAVGATLGILFAPDKGGETQDKFSRALSDLKDKIMDGAMQTIEKLTATSEGVAENLKEKFAEVKEDFQKEESEKIAEV